jgi:hypothetical protein
MSKTRPDWSQEITRRADDLVALRRDFHRHPELSHQERRTAEIIAERLRAAKLDVRTGVGGTGVVGVLHGDRPGPTIAWRADIDALPLTEMLEAPFASGTPGVMHACGHDGHTAIAITMADILAARRAELPRPATIPRPDGCSDPCWFSFQARDSSAIPIYAAGRPGWDSTLSPDHIYRTIRVMACICVVTCILLRLLCAAG